MKRIRLPLVFVAGPAALGLMAAIISGGVAASFAMGGMGWNAVDWTFFKWSCGLVAASAAVYLSGLFDWIGEDELKRMQDQELDASIRAKLGEPEEGSAVPSNEPPTPATARSFTLRYLRGLMIIGAVIFFLAKAGLVSLVDPGAVFGGGGAVRILNRDWTWSELAVMTPLIGVLAYYVRIAFLRIVRANRSRR